MAVFNRILNILVMIMAILAALFSWKLYERRAEMRERGDTLAKKINEAAVLLDAKTPENDRVAGSVTVQGIEKGKGTLGWMNFHDTTKRQDYVGNLDKFVTAAGKVTKQRDSLSTSLVAVDKLFREEAHPADAFDQYNDPDKSDKAFASLEVIMKDFYKRDNELIERLRTSNRLFDTNHDPSRGESRKDYASEFDKLDLAIKHEQTQNKRKTETLADVVSTLTTQYIGVSPEDMNELSELSQKTIGERVAKIKTDLDRIVILESTIKDREDTIKEKDAELDTKQDEILKKDAQITDLLEKKRNLENKIAMLTEQLRIARGEKTPHGGVVKYDGSILKVNYDYNYVVISFDKKKDKLPVSATLTVARDREYIAKVQVTKLFKNYAVADILPNEREGEIIEGDRVLKISF